MTVQLSIVHLGYTVNKYGWTNWTPRSSTFLLHSPDAADDLWRKQIAVSGYYFYRIEGPFWSKVVIGETHGKPNVFGLSFASLFSDQYFLKYKRV